MIPRKIKSRLRKDREMTSITIRIPVDVVDSFKAIASERGLTGYQTLMKQYLSEGLRADEASDANSANSWSNSLPSTIVSREIKTIQQQD